MKSQITRVCIAVLMMAMLTNLASAAMERAESESEVQLVNGKTWRGSVGDHVKLTFVEQGVEQTMTAMITKINKTYIMVCGNVAGKTAEKIIVIADLRAMETVEPTDQSLVAESITNRAGSPPESNAADPQAPGVFYMKLEGPVGDAIRLDEIKMLGEHVDTYGPGQIIVLHIESNGGLVYETRKISEAIRDIKGRHRVIAWVEKAISAGCWIAMCCDEIYFMTEGIAGSVTSVIGQTDASNREHTEALAALARENGYSEHIARAMKENRYMCSYTKDPVTGVVTFFGDLSGDVKLSDDDSNLNFNFNVALDCGFSKGTADTFDELAKVLDMPTWREKDDYGRKLMNDWLGTVERAQERIRLLIARLEYWKAAGDIVEQIGGRIQILREMIRWWDRSPNVARDLLSPKYQLEQEVNVLRRQLSELKRNRR